MTRTFCFSTLVIFLLLSTSGIANVKSKDILKRVVAENQKVPKKGKGAAKTTPPPVEPSVPAPAATEQKPVATPEPIVTQKEETVVDVHKEPASAKAHLLGPVSFGPEVTLLGFPTPFRFGLDTRYDELVGLSFDYGFFPSLTLSNIKVKYNSWRVNARVFPFRGALFVGFGYGKQSLDATKAEVISGTTVNFALNVNTTLLLPHIGWRWGGNSGFFFGVELGVQLASNSTAAFSSDTTNATILSSTEYNNNKNDIEKKGKDLGQTTLPHFGLIQMGWIF